MNTTNKPEAQQITTKNAPKVNTRGDANGPLEEHKAAMVARPVIKLKKNDTPT